jgi:hypothetical protein
LTGGRKNLTRHDFSLSARSSSGQFC